MAYPIPGHEQPSQATVARWQIHCVRKKRRFVKGPIPLPWIQQVGHLPGKAAHVGLALFYMAGLQRSYTVTLTRRRVAEFGVGPQAYARALAAMEKAGLVVVSRGTGKSARITLLAGEADRTGTGTDTQHQADLLPG